MYNPAPLCGHTGRRVAEKAGDRDGRSVLNVKIERRLQKIWEMRWNIELQYYSNYQQYFQYNKTFLHMSMKDMGIKGIKK